MQLSFDLLELTDFIIHLKLVWKILTKRMSLLPPPVFKGLRIYDEIIGCKKMGNI